jgi:putative phosphoesterase
MVRIGLLSDTHGYLDDKIFSYFDACDEVWHAGDIGTVEVSDQLEKFRPLRAVYGNIDGADLRVRYPLNLQFSIEGVDVLMTHIGGYPGRYTKRVGDLIKAHTPRLYICGHSHILKIMPDPKYQLLHVNPGACGFEGFHYVRTIVRFTLDAGNIKEMEVVELGKRSRG